MHNSKTPSYQGFVQRSSKSACATAPRVLLIGGQDPTGLAGIAADLATCSALVTPASVLVTTLTAQGRTSWTNSWPVPPAILQAQSRALLSDAPAVGAIKIGALGGEQQAHAVASLLADIQAQQPCPIVLDPVLNSTSGGTLGQEEWLQPLLAFSPLVCPNTEEYARMRSLQGFAQCPVLVTDRAPGACLIRPDHADLDFDFERLPGEWRGTGCTLSSAIACGLAWGHPLDSAIGHALASLHAWLRQSAPAFINRSPAS